MVHIGLLVTGQKVVGEREAGGSMTKVLEMVAQPVPPDPTQPNQNQHQINIAMLPLNPPFDMNPIEEIKREFIITSVVAPPEIGQAYTLKTSGIVAPMPTETNRFGDPKAQLPPQKKSNAPKKIIV